MRSHPFIITIVIGWWPTPHRSITECPTCPRNSDKRRPSSEETQGHYRKCDAKRTRTPWHMYGYCQGQGLCLVVYGDTVKHQHQRSVMLVPHCGGHVKRQERTLVVTFGPPFHWLPVLLKVKVKWSASVKRSITFTPPEGQSECLLRRRFRICNNNFTIY